MMGGIVLQYVATLSAATLMCSGYVANIWSSPIIPQLLEKNSPIGVTVTKDEAALITSFLLFGSVFGNIILGLSIDFFGRKGTLLIASVPIFICWILIIFAQSVSVLYAARFIQGTFVAAPMAVCMLYIGEISEAKIRGRLSLICFLISETATVLTVTLGSIISYKMLGAFGAVLPIIFFISFYWMPESPYYYVKIGDFENAEKSLKRLRNNKDVTEELSKMKKIIDQDISQRGSFFDLFTVKRFRIGILILLGLKTLQQMSGTTAINSYMKIIFEDSKTGLDADTSSIISVSVGLPAILLASCSIDKYGRKPLYYLATLGTTMSLIIESTYFFLQSNGHVTENNSIISWLPTAGIFLFHFFKSFGIGSLPLIFLGEIFPPQVKGHATSTALVYGSCLASLIAWGFPGFSDKFGYGVSFVIFASFCFGGFLFVRFLLPETKGKSLTDIQRREIVDV